MEESAAPAVAVLNGEPPFTASARPAGLPAPMLDSVMEEQCKDKDKAGFEAYPAVDDVNTLDDHTAVYATMMIAIPGANDVEAQEVKYAVPGSIETVGGNKVVKFYWTSLWKLLGVQAKTQLACDTAGVSFRRAFLEEVEESPKLAEATKITEHAAKMGGLEEFIAAALDHVYNNNPKFKENVDATKDEHASVVGEEHLPRLVFLKKMVKLMIEDKELTPAKYLEMRPRDLTCISADILDALKTNYITPTLEEMVSGVADQDEVRSFKSGMGKRALNAKWAYTVIDILVRDCTTADQSRVPRAPSADNVDEGDLGQIKNELATQGRLMKKLLEMAEQQQNQNLIRGGKGAVAETWSASFIKTPKDHECGFHVLQACAAKAINPDATPVMSSDNAKEAKSTVLAAARNLWLKDKSAFEIATGHKTNDSYIANIISPPATNNWKGEVEGVLFVSLHPTLEIRTLYKNKKGETQMNTTLQEGEIPRPFVGFSLLADNHHTLGAISVVGAKGTDIKYLFSGEDAHKAEQLLREAMGGSTPALAKKVTFVLDTTADQSDEEYKKCMLKLLNDSPKDKSNDPSDGVDWQTVVNKSKSKQKEAAKAKKAQEMVALEQKKEEDQRRQMAKTMELQYKKLGEMQIQMQQQARNGCNGSYSNAAAQQHQPQQGQPRIGQQQQHSQQSQPWGGQQQDRNDQQQPIQQQPWSGQQKQGKGTMANGVKVVEAVVVFGAVMNKKNFRDYLKRLNADAAAAVVSITEVKTGAPRFHLHCTTDNVALLHSLVPLMRDNGSRAAVYKEQISSQKTQYSANGLGAASTKAKVCQFFTAQKECPWRTKNGCCTFICYDGSPAAGGH
jgi:hypothetical protein